MKKQLQQFGQELLKLIYPQFCCACQNQVYGDAIMCSQCFRSLPFTIRQKPGEDSLNQLFWGRLTCRYVYSMLYMSKMGIVHELLHQLKYKDQTQIAEWAGKMMAKQLKREMWIADIDYIIPIPLNKKKLHQRGYNQAELIAQSLGKELSIPILPHAIDRRRHTSTQTKKNRAERIENMKEAFFCVNTDSLKYCHVLLLDDVITTGATIESCAKTLLEIEGLELSVASLAHAMI